MVNKFLVCITTVSLLSCAFGQLTIDLTKWQTVVDPTEQQAIWNRAWSKLLSMPCWDSSFVGDPTAFGTPAGVSQFSFGGYSDWRFVGSMDTYWGTVKVQSLGYYEGMDTVVMETWTGGYEGFIIGSGQYENQILHVLTNPSGVLYDVFYYAVPDSARCL
eukprot:TRINITY_DN2248_c1_g1_i2.p2 TRINITY_DN2248_c1_g1~~TRINITY_DN2248_c1_g1_i2.p2  ORF type:complete len:172 (-),score=13.22 TRINITY_DN2248_c1_g1_i2:563-1042(-)